jgi:lipid-A-disaccharide synthase
LIANLQFNSPSDPSIDLLIIAGEASGDEHGSLLLEDLSSSHPHLKCAAIGGPHLEKKGAFLVYPLVKHAVVGIIEVLKNYRTFKQIFSNTIEWIKEHKPKAVLLVDYPGFNLRLARELQKIGISEKGGGQVKIIQYISPQLWAWKPKRRFLMEQVLDGLGVIFPFEVECYKDTRLPVSFVGHPFTKSNYISPVHYESDGPLLLLPGSRRQPVERILPILLDAYEQLLILYPNLPVQIPVPDSRIRIVVDKILSKRNKLKDNIQVVEEGKILMARAAMMSSGTMSLSCALAGIPGLIAYRAHPLTYFLGRILVKVPYLGMANILIPDNPPYSEFIQHNANGRNLSQSMVNIFRDTQARNQAERNAKKLYACLTSAKQKSTVDWLVQEASLT